MGTYRGKYYLKAWDYVFLDVLYAIPVVGIIFMLLHAYNGNKTNRQQYARSCFVRILMITIVGIGVFYSTVGKDAVVAKYNEITAPIAEYFDSLLHDGSTVKSSDKVPANEVAVNNEVNRRNLAREVFPLNNDVDIYAAVLRVEADLKPNTTYTLSFVANAGNVYYVNEALVNESLYFTSTGGRQSITFTIKSVLNRNDHAQHAPSEGYGWIILKNAQENNSPHNFRDIQIEEGNTATAYKPYN